MAALIAIPAPSGAAEDPNDAIETAAEMRYGISLEVPPGAEIAILGPDAGSPAESGSRDDVRTSPYDAQADVVLCSETFEASFPGNASCNWALRYCGQGYTWDDDACRASSGSYSAWCANGRYANQSGLNPCTTSYPNDLCAFMIAGPYDLGDATAASVQYDFWLRAQGAYYDFLYVGYSTDGTSFTNGDQFTGDYGDIWNRNRTLSLQPVVGRSQVWIGFAFFTDQWGNFNSQPNGAFIDNIRIAKTSSSAADLVVTALEPNNASCPTQVRAMVRNQGNAGSGANTCRFWRGQTQLSDVGIRALAAGEQDWSGWSPLGTYTPGDYAIRGCADIAGQIQEQDESNNCLTVNYTGWCLTPDLTVLSLDFDNAACPTQVRARVKNIGGGTAASSTCRFWMDEILKGNASIRALPAGDEDWSGWCAIGSPTGNHAVRSCVDPDGSLSEGDEQNNCLSGNYIGWCQAPDLQVSTLQFDPSNCPTRMRAEVRNAGTSAAGASICRLSVGGAPECDLTVGTLAAGASAWTDWCSIDATGYGTFRGEACADATQLVVEANEDNNCRGQDFSCSTNRFYVPAGIEFAAGAGDVIVPVSALNTDALTGFSMSICFDPEVFLFRGATVAGTRASGATNLVVSEAQNGCVSVAVVYSHGCPSSIAPGDGAVLNLQLTVVAGAPVGTSLIAFSDRPPTLNRMTLCNFSTIIPGFGADAVEILSNGFIRGDFDANGSLGIADAIAGLYYVVGEGVSPPCEDAADLNDDGGLDVSDPVYSLAYQFGSGSAPPPPFPGCGADPTPDNIDCAGFAGCGPLMAARSGGAAKLGHTSTVELTSRYSATGDTLVVPLTMDLAEEAAGFDVTLAFDPAVLEYLELAIPAPGAERYGYCSARVLDSANIVRLGVVQDLGLRNRLSPGRHSVTAMIFRVRNARAVEGSRIDVTGGQVVTGPAMTAELEGAGLTLPRPDTFPAGDFALRLTNPYRPGLPISIELSAAADARLTIYNVHGRKVRDLVSRGLGAGSQEVRWDGKDSGGQVAGAGVYYMSGAIGGQPVHRKLILIR
jgi:hypothetical protein